MMSAWNLLWILPLAYFFGFVTCTLLTVSRDEEYRQNGQNVSGWIGDEPND